VVRRKLPPEPEEEGPVVRRKRSPKPEEEEEGPRPARRRPEPASEEDDDEEEPEEEEVRPRRRRRRFLGSRQRARDAVAAPAIALMVLGGTYVCISILALVLRLTGFSFMAPQEEERLMQNPGYKFGHQLGVTAGVIIEVVGMCLGGIMISGALQMKKLKSYGYALTATIVAMLPCHYCCLLGIGFGIWALVVINRADVRSCFG
jgi:hypothetical protein